MINDDGAKTGLDQTLIDEIKKQSRVSVLREQISDHDSSSNHSKKDMDDFKEKLENENFLTYKEVDVP